MEPAPRNDRNTCGQIAVAIVLARMGNAADGSGPIEPGATEGAAEAVAIERIRRAFPPDIPLGFGTSAPRLIAALRAHDVEAAWVHGGWFGARAARSRQALVAHLASGRLAIVCLDHGLLGGAPFVA